MFNYGRHSIDASDIEAVAAVLGGDMLTTGPEVAAFEADVAAYCGVRHAVAVSSGTAALHLACLAMGAGPGSRGWISPITFVADANALRYCGADVGMVDIDPDTVCMDVDLLRRDLEAAEADGTLPDIVVPVDFGGEPADMAAIRALSDRYGFKILQDACQAFGGAYAGAPLGSCSHSDATAISLHPVKTITSGEGGIVTTNDDAIAAYVRRARSHGIVKGETDPWIAEMVDEGFNYRLSDIQCALGRSQLHRIDRFVAHRAGLAALYRDALAGCPVAFQKTDPSSRSAWHLMLGFFDHAAIGKSKRQVYDELCEHGVRPMVHYLPVHLHRFYRDRGFRPGQFPNAEAYYARAFSLPLHAELTADDIKTICSHVRHVVGTDQ